ncbi:MAG TPA: rRNA maturation RNase YbeY [Chitinophagaceae bacterium]|nr:rRNA maturation RNase YbeY [Chitinophagaceae bacterium]
MNSKIGYKSTSVLWVFFTNFETMTSKSKVYFFFERKGFSLTNRLTLKKFIESIFKTEKRKLETLNFVFVSDKKLLEINRQYLKHDYFTDIISFELSHPEMPVVGDIYISIDRVKENAVSLGVSFKSELHRVIFHGVLHLCGFGDKSKKEAGLIREKENFYLQKYLR